MDNEENLTTAIPNDKPSEIKESTESSDASQTEPKSESVDNTSESNNDTNSDLTEDSSTNPSASSKRLFTFLKSKVGICVMAAIVVVGVLAFVFINKYTNEKNYEKNLKEFVIESSKASMASAYICDDLRKVWQEYIFDDKEYFKRSTGTFTSYSYDGDEYCSDFSEAVNRKIRWNEEHLTSEITEPYRTAKRLYKEMTPPPGKYKEIHAYVKQMFKAMERLHELSEDPKGNLTSYSSDCNTAGNEFTSALSDLTNECDIDFSKIDD